VLRIFSLFTHCKQFSIGSVKILPDFLLENTIRVAIHTGVRKINLDHMVSRWKSSGCINRCV